MALVRAYKSTDMLGQLGSNALANYGSITIANNSQIQIAYNGEIFNIYGSFSYSGGYLTGGTFTSLTYIVNGSKYFELSGGSWTLQSFIDAAPYIDDFIFRGADRMYGSSQNDVLIGYRGNDLLNGNGGADVLYGEQGNDTLNGGNGNDTLYGGVGSDKLNGGSGADTMLGGSGNDRYYVNSVSDSVTETSNAGTDTVYSSITYTLGSNLENLVLQGNNAINGTGNSLNNKLTGNAASNILTGLAGNDTLNGKGGADTMIGGLGNDRYYVNHAADLVTESASEGTDTVYSSISYTLATDVENLVLTGTNNINGTGNTLDNKLTGNAKSNTLDGLTGDDTMIGKAGNDRYYIDSIGDVVVEQFRQGSDSVYSTIDYVLGSHLERLNLTGTDNLNGIGNNVGNVLKGNSGDNSLSGLGGNDIIKGDDGDDTLLGGGGNDRLYGENGSDTITGGNGHDFLYGGNDNDILIGGAGNDRLFGGADEDTASYASTTGRVSIDLKLTTAQNTVSAGDDLLDSIENLIGSNYNDKLIGNSEDNELSGGLGADKLYGGDGNDLLSGGDNNDFLAGNNGDDTLVGGDGSDTLKGGAGNDIFLLDSLDGVDDILDFDISEDILQLDQTIFTGLSETADQLDASDFLSSSTLDFNTVLSGATILYETNTGSIYYDSDGGTANNATLVATVTDLLTVQNTHFDLV
jgi:Ca2+-binding RTX toxin-like protein